MTSHVTQAVSADIDELAAVAAATFPLACPPSATEDNIAAFIAANLSAARFTEYLDDPDRAVLVARRGDGTAASPILGYAMLIRGLPDDPDVQQAVTVRPSAELSKIYVLPDSHGGEVSSALMNAALTHAAGWGARSMWLGVNEENQRAQRFYGKSGFAVTGTKSFHLGERIEHDYVLVREL